MTILDKTELLKEFVSVREVDPPGADLQPLPDRQGGDLGHLPVTADARTLLYLVHRHQPLAFPAAHQGVVRAPILLVVVRLARLRRWLGATFELHEPLP